MTIAILDLRLPIANTALHVAGGHVKRDSNVSDDG